MGQSLIRYISTFVCAARGTFIQVVINFRQQQRQARVDKIDLKKFPRRTGGEANSQVLWPEVVEIGEWGNATDPVEWNGK